MRAVRFHRRRRKGIVPCNFKRPCGCSCDAESVSGFLLHGVDVDGALVEDYSVPAVMSVRRAVVDAVRKVGHYGGYARWIKDVVNADGELSGDTSGIMVSSVCKGND